jgi:hypothetical protein
MADSAAPAALVFPAAPPAHDAAAELASLLPLQQSVAALALGGARMLGLTGRHELHGAPRRLALRTAHGAYLRLARPHGSSGGNAGWTLVADGEQPSCDACVFTLQKGGVALHLKVTLRSAAGTLVAAAAGGEVSADRLPDGCGGGDGEAVHAEEAERWRVEAAPAGQGGVSLQCRGGGFLSADASGYVSARAPRAGVRQTFWLCDPAREQARVDAYRRAVAQAEAQCAAEAPQRPGSPLSECSQEADADADAAVAPGALPALRAARADADAAAAAAIRASQVARSAAQARAEADARVAEATRALEGARARAGAAAHVQREAERLEAEAAQAQAQAQARAEAALAEMEAEAALYAGAAAGADDAESAHGTRPAEEPQQPAGASAAAPPPASSRADESDDWVPVSLPSGGGSG